MTTNCVPVWRERCANSAADYMGGCNVDYWECVTVWVRLCSVGNHMSGCGMDVCGVGKCMGVCDVVQLNVSKCFWWV
jgi:hypothetical protein